MIKKVNIHHFILSFLLFTGGIPSKAAEKCSEMFFNAASKDWVSEISQKIKITTERKVEASSKIFDYLKSINPHEIVKYKNIDFIVSRLLLELSGSQVNFKFYEFRESQKIIIKNWVVREVVRNGLLEFAQSNLNNKNPRLSSKIKILLNNIFNNPFMKTILLPLLLPHVADVKIESEILQDIIIHGIKNNDAKLKELYNKQKYIEIYNAAQKIISYAFVPIILALIIIGYPELKEIVGRINAQIFIKEIREETLKIKNLNNALDIENDQLRMQNRALKEQKAAMGL